MSSSITKFNRSQFETKKNRFKSTINIVVVVFSKFRTSIALPAFYNLCKRGISNKILEIKNCIKVERIIMKVVR